MQHGSGCRLTLRNMNIYISGKITGLQYSDYAAKFAHAAEIIRAQGFTPLNPVELTRHLPEGSKWEDYMAVCLPALLKCDRIYLLPDWRDSRGGQAERWCAFHNGIDIWKPLTTGHE